MTVCRECGTSNRSGSKYCNNCGAALPPATKLICPNCQTPNVATLLYCDNCGTRLVDSDFPESEAEKPAGSVPGPDPQRFSLPSRPPGETANLDVGGEIPDWLRTGNTRNLEQPPEETEETTPDWLGDLEAPDSSEEDAGALLSSALSGWLDDLEEIEAEDEEPAATTVTPDWLADLDEIEAEDEELASLETPDWLAGFGEPEAEEEQAGAADVADWIAGLETDALEAEEAAEAPPRTTGDVPDWLAEAGVDEPETLGEEMLPAWLRDAEAALQAEETMPPAEEGPEWEEAPDLADEPPEAVLPDWLADLAEPDTGPLPLERSAAGPDTTAEDELPAPAGESEVEPEPVSAEEAGEAGDDEDFSTWLEEMDVIPAAPDVAPTPRESQPLPDDLPDWLREPVEDLPAGVEDFESLWDDEDLEPFPPLPRDTEALSEEPAALESDEPEEALPAEEMPEWLSEVMEELDDEAPETGGTAEAVEPSDEMRNVPSQIAGPQLPGWLQDAESDITVQGFGSPGESVPDWLQPEDDEADLLDLDDVDEASREQRRELAALLQDLPPAERLRAAETLGQGEIPVWLDAMRPGDLDVEDELVGEVAEEGPLAGLRGIIGIEPVVLQKPHETRPIARLAVTPEQRQQVALLRQLTQAEHRQPVQVASTRPAALAPAVQLLLALLLLAAVLAGLLLSPLVETVPPAAPGAAPALQAVDSAAGRPVLVAFDYSPALAGELTPQAEFLLRRLAANGSPALLVSQSAAGITIAEQMAGEVEGLNALSLGFLPGETFGLRELGNCLQQALECHSLYGRTLDAALPPALADLGLIIILTADRNEMVNWIEQVEPVVETPLLAGVPQALAPVAAPYFNSGQLQGLVNGLPGTAQLEQAAGESGPAAERLEALTLAQWLVVALLIAGNVVGLVQGVVKRQ